MSGAASHAICFDYKPDLISPCQPFDPAKRSAVSEQARATAWPPLCLEQYGSIGSVIDAGAASGQHGRRDGVPSFDGGQSNVHGPRRSMQNTGF